MYELHKRQSRRERVSAIFTWAWLGAFLVIMAAFVLLAVAASAGH